MSIITITRGNNKWLWSDIPISTPTDHFITINNKNFFLSDDAIEEYLNITAYYVGGLIGLPYYVDPIKYPKDLDLLADVAINWSNGEREMVIKNDGSRYYVYKK